MLVFFQIWAHIKNCKHCIVLMVLLMKKMIAMMMVMIKFWWWRWWQWWWWWLKLWWWWWRWCCYSCALCSLTEESVFRLVSACPRLHRVCCCWLGLFCPKINLILCHYFFVSSVRSSSGYHGLLEIRQPLFQIFQILQILKWKWKWKDPTCAIFFKSIGFKDSRKM